MENLIVSFAPYGGSITNGSSTVGAIVAARHGWEHVVLSVHWCLLTAPIADMSKYAHILGVGEGYHHFIGVERMARRGGTVKDDLGLDPPADLPSDHESTLVCRDLRWHEKWMTPKLLESLSLPGETLGIAENGYAGSGLCNELLYRLLYDKWKQNADTKVGGIHVPKEAAWTARTGRSDYGPVFARGLEVIMQHNRWLPRSRR